MKKPILALLTFVGAMVLMTAGASASDEADLHCPDKDNPGKVEGAESAGSLVLAEGTEFCAKKQTGTTGVIIADGTTSIYEYLVAAGIDGEPGEGPSYYIVYAPSEPEPCDETDPEAECYEPPCDPTDPNGECYLPPPPPPVDVCPNIDGDQATVPDGMVVDQDGKCVLPPPPPPPVDLCPNIDGDQTTVPDGMELDDDGDCETTQTPPPPPPVDFCPNIPGDQAEMPVYWTYDSDGNCYQEPPGVTPIDNTPKVTSPPVVVDQPPAVVNNTVVRTAPRPMVESTQLAATGSNDSLPVVALTGFGMLAAGLALTRKYSSI